MVIEGSKITLQVKKVTGVILAMCCLMLPSCSKGTDKTVENSKWMEGGTSLHNTNNCLTIWRQGDYIYYLKFNQTENIDQLYEYDIKTKKAIPVKSVNRKTGGTAKKGEEKKFEDLGSFSDAIVFGRYCAVMRDTNKVITESGNNYLQHVKKLELYNMDESSGAETIEEFDSSKNFSGDHLLLCPNYYNYRLIYSKFGEIDGPLMSYDVRNGKKIQIAPIAISYVLANNRAYYIDEKYKLFSVKLDGTDRQQISDFTIFDFSVGNKSIFFIKGKVDGPSDSSVYSMDLDGGNVHPIYESGSIVDRCFFITVNKLVCLNEGSAYAIENKGGKWCKTFEYKDLRIPVEVHGSDLFFTDKSGRIVWYDKDNQKTVLELP